MLLEANRFQDLSHLYDLFIRFKNGLGLIKKAFANYIKVCGWLCLMGCVLWLVAVT